MSLEWLTRYREPGPLLEAFGPALPTRKRLLFGAACCRRVAPLLTDDRVLQAVELVERFADGLALPVDLIEAQPSVRAALEDAFFEQRCAEADANFGTHPAHSLAMAVEAAVFAVGALFDQAATGHAPPAVDFTWAIDRGPHHHTVSAAYYWAEAFAIWAYNPRRSDGYRSTSYKVGEVAGRRVMWSEDQAQTAILRDLIGPSSPPQVSDWRSRDVTGLAKAAERGEWGTMQILADALEDSGCTNSDILEHCRGSGPHVRGCWVVDLLLEKY